MDLDVKARQLKFEVLPPAPGDANLLLVALRAWMAQGAERRILGIERIADQQVLIAYTES